jgi:hypothetical protein
MRSRPIAWALASLAVCTAAMVAGILSGWPGDPSQCAKPPYCFCETVRAGAVAQPSNTWSNLAFVAVALWIAWDATRRAQRPDVGQAQSRYLSDSRYPAIYAAIVLFMGPGSMFFHAGMTNWGGRVDGVSMYLFILFALSFRVARIWNLSFSGFAGAMHLYFASEREGADHAGAVSDATPVRD